MSSKLPVTYLPNEDIDNVDMWLLQQLKGQKANISIEQPLIVKCGKCHDRGFMWQNEQEHVTYSGKDRKGVPR